MYTPQISSLIVLLLCVMSGTESSVVAPALAPIAYSRYVHPYAGLNVPYVPAHAFHRTVIPAGPAVVPPPLIPGVTPHFLPAPVAFTARSVHAVAPAIAPAFAPAVAPAIAHALPPPGLHAHF